MSTIQKPIIAIAYDFDGTLAPGNMQEHSYIPALGMTKEDFWQETKDLAERHDMDDILTYMYLMLEKARAKHVPIHRKQFLRHANGIQFFPGVESWFDRINKSGEELGVTIEHYIISSGLREIIQATPIARHFKYIFASAFMFDENDIPRWPALAINYTTKTQYLFRINKGIMNCHDNVKVNTFMKDDDRRISFKNMIFIGDGDTDIACMKTIMHQGGAAIVVYDPNKQASGDRPSGKDQAEKLVYENRAHYLAPANYEPNQPLEQILQRLITRIAKAEELKQFHTTTQK